MTGLGVSADAFAVAVCKGLGMGRVNWRHALAIALFFGGFQALMPLFGCALDQPVRVAVGVEPRVQHLRHRTSLGSRVELDDRQGAHNGLPGSLGVPSLEARRIPVRRRFSILSACLRDVGGSGSVLFEARPTARLTLSQKSRRSGCSEWREQPLLQKGNYREVSDRINTSVGMPLERLIGQGFHGAS